MIDDVGDIANYYNSDPLSERNRLERHRLEFDLTWRCLERCLPPSGTILEIGAATGRYTLELARRGYQITAVDLSNNLLEICRSDLESARLDSQVRLFTADARDLSAIPGSNFDAVLLMGPLYHLVEEPDRLLALRQAYDRLRSGGVIFSAFISRLGIFGDLIKNIPAWIESETEVRALLDRGCDPAEIRHAGFRGYFARPEEIVPLHAAVGFKTIALVGVEPGISADDESYNRLDDSLKHLWLNLFESISTEPSIIGASRHLLYIGRKL